MAADGDPRLRPVFDALDRGQPKAALKLLRGYESKRKDGLADPSALPLCALALARLGRMDACYEAVDRVLEAPASLTSMHVSLMLFKEIDRVDLHALLVQRAFNRFGGWKKGPSEQLALNLFFSYLRSYDFGMQQQVALKMATAFHNVLYLDWMAANILIQVNSGPLDKKHTMMLQLAYKLYEKNVGSIAECSTTLQYTRRWIWMEICQHLHKWDDVLLLTQSATLEDKKEMIRRLEMVTQECKAMCSIGTPQFVQGAFHRLAAFFKADPTSRDNWGLLSPLIDSGIATDAHQLRSTLKDLHEENPKLRGPILAAAKTAILSNNDEHLCTALNTFTAAYGHKPCFLSDLSSILPADHRAWNCIVDALEAHTESSAQNTWVWVGDEKEPLSAALPYLRRQLVSRVIRLMQHQQIDWDDTLRLVVDVEENHLPSAPVDIGPIDDLVAALMVAMDPWDAVHLGEYMMKKHHNSATVAIVLLRILCSDTIGAPLYAYELYCSLNIKQIQHESLSYLVFDDLVRYGHEEEAVSLVGDLSEFHEGYKRDAADLITLAYKKENLIQVMDQSIFCTKMKRSLQTTYAFAWDSYPLGGPEPLPSPLSVGPKLESKVDVDHLVLNNDVHVIPAAIQRCAQDQRGLVYPSLWVPIANVDADDATRRREAIRLIHGITALLREPKEREQYAQECDRVQHLVSDACALSSMFQCCASIASFYLEGDSDTALSTMSLLHECLETLQQRLASEFEGLSASSSVLGHITPAWIADTVGFYQVILTPLAHFLKHWKTLLLRRGGTGLQDSGAVDSVIALLNTIPQSVLPWIRIPHRQEETEPVTREPSPLLACGAGRALLSQALPRIHRSWSASVAQLEQRRGQLYRLFDTL